MARKTRSPEVVERIKNNIIEEAMGLIIEMGFKDLSLRKLAERVGMSATNLYYYYSSKDEIYLNIQIKGFGLLKEKLDKIYDEENTPVESLRKMIKTYLEFGFRNPDYYQIMLNSETPRYLEYKNKNHHIEPIALEAKQMAEKAISAPLKVLEAISEQNSNFPESDINFRAHQLWITLHGLITLNNRNILSEIDEIVPENLIERMCDDLMRPLLK